MSRTIIRLTAAGIISLSEACTPCPTAADTGLWDDDSDGYSRLVPTLDAKVDDVCAAELAGGEVDCDDADPAVYPGAPEVVRDGVDQNCDGDLDLDGDGFSDETGDCDDTSNHINPLEPEVCDDVDNDCDGEIDEDCIDPTTDGDGDGSVVAEDCDDAESSTHPGAEEFCDDVDNDCDGEIDNEATDATTWYADADGDGYGDVEVTIIACDQPTAYVEDATDCDDADDSSNPGATEVRDGVDNDCDGETDERELTKHRSAPESDIRLPQQRTVWL